MIIHSFFSIGLRGVRLVTFLAWILTAVCSDAAHITNIRLRSDGSAVAEGRAFRALGPNAFVFDTGGGLWSGELLKDGAVFINKQNSRGWRTGEYSFPGLKEGSYSLNIRILGQLG